MKHLLIASDNVLDECTLSGGAWTTGLPLSYLQTRQVDQKARAVSALKRDTWFYVAAPSTVTVATAALFGGNFSESAQWRLRGWDADPRGAVDGVFTGGVLPAGFTVERSTSGTYFGADGLLKTAGNNEARFEYTDGVCEGVLLEEASANSLLWCRDGSNAAWTKSSMSATKTATGIDGAANSATTLSASGSTGRIYQAGAYTVFSVWLRRVSGTGAIKITGDGFASTTTVTLTTSWLRFSVARTGNCGIQVDVSGDVIEMDYAQDEDGTIATSPILTTTALVTRAADALKFTGAAAAGVSFTSGAVMVHGKLLRRPRIATSAMVYMQGPTSANYVGTNMTTGGVQQAAVVASGAAQVASVDSSAISVGSTFSSALSWAANDVRGSYDAAAVVSDNAATMPTVAVSYLSALGGACWYVRRLKAYPAAKTNAQLQGLSGSEMELPADTDSGWIDAWPSAYLSGTSARKRTGAKTPALHRPATPYQRRYWRVDIDDESNSDGYVELGRPCLFWDAYQATYNVNTGVGITFEPRASSVTTDSGARYFEERPQPRVLRWEFPALADAEAWQTHYELMRRQGTTGEVLVSLNPDDLANQPRQTFLATIDSLPTLQSIAAGFWSASYTAKELL